MRKIIGLALGSLFILSLPTVSMAKGDDFSFSINLPNLNVNAAVGNPIPPPVAGPAPGFRWVNIVQGQPLPPRAVVGGFENGQPRFVCHAPFNGGVHPGKVVNGACNISWGGKEIVRPRFQVLAGRYPFNWVKAGNGFIPRNAVPGGFENGHPLFICQAKYQGGIQTGKVVGPTCNFGYAGVEVLKSNYKVLTF